MKKNVLVIFIVSKYDTSPNSTTEQKDFSGHVLPLSSFPLLLNHHPPSIFSPPLCLPDTSATKVEAAVLPPNKTYKSMKVNFSLQLYGN
jgi:hypothetical protein